MRRIIALASLIVASLLSGTAIAQPGHYRPHTVAPIYGPPPPGWHIEGYCVERHNYGGRYQQEFRRQRHWQERYYERQWRQYRVERPRYRERRRHCECSWE